MSFQLFLFFFFDILNNFCSLLLLHVVHWNKFSGIQFRDVHIRSIKKNTFVLLNHCSFSFPPKQLNIFHFEIHFFSRIAWSLHNKTGLIFKRETWLFCWNVPFMRFPQFLRARHGIFDEFSSKILDEMAFFKLNSSDISAFCKCGDSGLVSWCLLVRPF